MLNLTITFLIIAVIAAVLGFGGIASVSVQLAQILFFVFLFLFVVSLVMQIAKKGDQFIDKNL